ETVYERAKLKQVERRSQVDVEPLLAGAGEHAQIVRNDGVHAGSELAAVVANRASSDVRRENVKIVGKERAGARAPRPDNPGQAVELSDVQIRIVMGTDRAGVVEE